MEDNDTKGSKYIELLSNEDRIEYYALKSEFSQRTNKYRRGKRKETLEDNIIKVIGFCEKKPQDSWKRSLVCGVCNLGTTFAVSILQLKELLDKSKSTINGGLVKIGYIVSERNFVECIAELVDTIPLLKGNFIEQRKWSFRTKLSSTPTPHRDENPISLENSSAPYSPDTKDRQMNVSIKGDIMKLFGIMDGKIVEGNECHCKSKNSKDAKWDFFADPTCCCPVEWIYDEFLINDTSFG